MKYAFIEIHLQNQKHNELQSANMYSFPFRYKIYFIQKKKKTQEFDSFELIMDLEKANLSWILQIWIKINLFVISEINV